jgi:hypothetical protein
MAFLLLTCWGLKAVSGEQAIRIGGVRDVTATVSSSDGVYHIAVQMLPVEAFDPATNKRLNLSKARMYAMQALANYLRTENLTIRGLEIQESGTKGDRFWLVVRIARKGVSVGTAAKSPPPKHPRTADAASRSSPPASSPERPQSVPQRHEIGSLADATVADFLNRKADYLDTIVRLRESLSEEGGSLERQSLKPEDFYDSIGSVEERAEAAFKAIGGQIDEDKLLLRQERDELRPALKTAHAEVLRSLKAAVARFDQRQEKSKKERKK